MVSKATGRDMDSPIDEKDNDVDSQESAVDLESELDNEDGIDEDIEDTPSMTVEEDDIAPFNAASLMQMHG